MKGNTAVPKNHFKKTAKRIKTWFAQPIKAIRRKQMRVKKEKKIFPMPLQKLRPVVRCPTIRHNRKLRLGRGFTPEECRSADIDYRTARTLGVSVDLRRKNQNEESFEKNVDRLKEYISHLRIFENKKEAINSGVTQHKGKLMPIPKGTKIVKTVSVSEVEGSK